MPKTATNLGETRAKLIEAERVLARQEARQEAALKSVENASALLTDLGFDLDVPLPEQLEAMSEVASGLVQEVLDEIAALTEELDA